VIAFYKQCGKRYCVDEILIKRSTGLFDYGFCGSLIFAKKHEEPLIIYGHNKKESFNSPLADFYNANESIDKSYAFKPTSDPPKRQFFITKKIKIPYKYCMLWRKDFLCTHFSQYW
jgi:hypothetical protein